MSRTTDQDFSPDREPTPAEQAALRWVTRGDRGLDESERAQFARWLEEDSANRELFEEFRSMWRLMGRTGDLAALTCVPPAEGAETDSAAPKTTVRARPARRWAWASLAAAIAIVSVGVWRQTPHDAAITTEVGALQRIELPDGSVVRLNTDSALATAFTATERRVRLERGEAYFEVAKNPDRPFIVEAAGVGVRAVGTAFNVRLRAEAVEVLVTEGKVRVAPGVTAAVTNPAANGTPLAAGERLVVPVGSAAPAVPLAIKRVPADEAHRLLAWHDRLLDFSDTPLSEMVAEFNRYNAHKLAVADPDVGAMRFGGSFRPDDRPGFVRMLRETFGLQAEERGNETVLRAGR